MNELNEIPSSVELSPDHEVLPVGGVYEVLFPGEQWSELPDSGPLDLFWKVRFMLHEQTMQIISSWFDSIGKSYAYRIGLIPGKMTKSMWEVMLSGNQYEKHNQLMGNSEGLVLKGEDIITGIVRGEDPYDKEYQARVIGKALGMNNNGDIEPRDLFVAGAVDSESGKPKALIVFRKAPDQGTRSQVVMDEVSGLATQEVNV